MFFTYFETAVKALACSSLTVPPNLPLTEISKFVCEQEIKMASYMAPGAEITEEKLQDKGDYSLS